MTNLIETVYKESATFAEVSSLHKESGSKAILSALELRINSDADITYDGDIFVTASATINVLVDGGWITNTFETPGIFGLSSDIEIDPHCYETELYTLFEILAALNVDCGAISSADIIINKAEVFA